MNDLTAEQLAVSYEFLGESWLVEPDETRRDSLNTEGGPIEDLQELSQEFCRLLIGPKDHLPPFQSVWQSQQLAGPATVSMNRYFAQSGYSAAADESADHIGQQLPFFGWLLRASEAETNSQTALMVLHEFQDAHLTWQAPFLQAVAEKTKFDYFRRLSVMTSEAIQAGAEYLRLRDSTAGKP